MTPPERSASRKMDGLLGKLRPHFRRRVWIGLTILGVVWFLLFVFHLTKPLPPGISFLGQTHDVSGAEFLFDLTYQRDGDTVVEQEIFDRILSMVAEADGFMVLDMFLFNGGHGGEEVHRPLSSQITDALLARKRSTPGLDVRFITDEFNNHYGAYVGEEIQRLQGGGIEVIVTRLSSLRDSNPAYSAFWRMALRWMGTGGPGWLPNLLIPNGPKVTARSLLKVPNFKANHRKLIVTDKGCLVSSANPHDASSLHSNIAFFSTGSVCGEILESERAVASFSGGDVEDWPQFEVDTLPGRGGGAGLAGPSSGEGTVQLVTEGKILAALLNDVGAAGSGDRIDLAMFYLSHRRVVEALVGAHGRGVSVRLVLDPNKDAFGREKGGIPNRQVARELVTRSGGGIQVRWYDTHGEQFHAKLAAVTRADSVVVFGGSANLTRRNIGDFNLETDLRFSLPREAELAQDVGGYFEGIFNNRYGDFTLSYEAYRDDSLLKRLRYRFEEFTGLCSY
jgi:hypothetical protein